MTTATQTKSSLGTLFLVGVIALAAVSWARGKGEGTPGREDTQDNIVFEIHFDPNPRKPKTVHVIAVTEAPLHDLYPEKSPWIKSEWVPKGAKVQLDGWQVNNGTLRCIIRHKGAKVADNTSTQAGGHVKCVYRSLT